MDPSQLFSLTDIHSSTSQVSMYFFLRSSSWSTKTRNCEENKRTYKRFLRHTPVSHVHICDFEQHLSNQVSNMNTIKEMKHQKQYIFTQTVNPKTPIIMNYWFCIINHIQGDMSIPEQRVYMCQMSKNIFMGVLDCRRRKIRRLVPFVLRQGFQGKTQWILVELFHQKLMKLMLDNWL